MKNIEKNMARIFEDTDGYHVCSDDLDYLDARGYAHKTKASALASAYEQGYTHATGSGAYRTVQVQLRGKLM